MAKNSEKRKRTTKKNKNTSFTKLRTTVFNEAKKLSSAFGDDVEMLLLVFSPRGKPYNFATPSFEAVANRFHQQYPAAAHDDATEERVGRTLQHMGFGGSNSYLFTKPLEQQTEEELITFMALLDELKDFIRQRFLASGIDPSRVPFFRDDDSDDDDDGGGGAGGNGAVAASSCGVTTASN